MCATERVTTNIDAIYVQRAYWDVEFKKKGKNEKHFNLFLLKITLNSIRKYSNDDG